MLGTGGLLCMEYVFINVTGMGSLHGGSTLKKAAKVVPHFRGQEQLVFLLK